MKVKDLIEEFSGIDSKYILKYSQFEEIDGKIYMFIKGNFLILEKEEDNDK